MIKIAGHQLLIKLIASLDKYDSEERNLYISFYDDGHWSISTERLDLSIFQFHLLSLKKGSNKKVGIEHEVVYLENLLNDCVGITNVQHVDLKKQIKDLGSKEEEM